MGLQLKAIRRSHKMTQKELAALIGQTDRVVGAWERGESALPIDEAARIADVFDVSLDELAGRDWHAGHEYADPRQSELNRCWESLDTERQNRVIADAQDMEIAKRGEGAAVRPALEA
ncbi:MAG: helix-turn-helix transcriptional regulator [Atopobiaceae bacterium]|nr:helix-turn-helix transcriptional regulator [Atopobiaceae bacterium]